MRLSNNAVNVGINLTALACWSDAEASASSVASASCYCLSKDVFVLAVVLPKLKLIQVQGQVFLADVVIRPDDSAFDQCPERFDVVRVDIAAHVFATAVADYSMRISAIQDSISSMFIGRDQTHAIRHRIANEAIESFSVRIFDDPADHVAFARDCTDHGRLSTQAGNVLLLVGVSILIESTYASLINFNNAHKLFKIPVAHTGAKPMADIPSGMQRRRFAKEHTANLARRNTLLALKHGVENLEPRYERDVRVLEHRAYQNREPIRRAFGLPAVHALPVERPRRSAFVQLSVVATRTMRAIRPATHRQIGPASRFIGKGRHEFLEGNHASEISGNSSVSQVP
jgi:hypothetical protein